MNKKWIGIVIVLLVVCCVASFGLMQIIPLGRSHQNPPVVKEPNWASPTTRELAKRACFDCHSNETVWPWYSNIAPFSWLVQHDVDEGREKLNFSEWGSREQEADEIVEVLQDGEMPPAIYLPMHPDAKLTAAEKEELMSGFRSMFASGD